VVGKGAVNRREQGLAILRVDWLCRAPYEWGEHADIAKRYGVTTAEIERLTHGSAAGRLER
jgi:4-carboxymuconolactone decarboxylase